MGFGYNLYIACPMSGAKLFARNVLYVRDKIVKLYINFMLLALSEGIFYEK